MNAPTPTSDDPEFESAPAQQGRRFRRATAIGLTAGLLGGGAAGLMFAVPSLTSAASGSVTLQDTGDTSTDSDSATVTDDDQPADDTADDTARPERGERLREQLQSLVDDGTITAEQADAVTAHLVENFPHRGGHGGPGGGRGFDGTVVADALGITTDELRTALRDGQSIADVAAAQGVDVQVVIDAIVTAAETRIAEAVTEGRITQEEADAKLAELTERVTERVEQGGGFGRGGRGPGGTGALSDDAAPEATADA